MLARDHQPEPELLGNLDQLAMLGELHPGLVLPPPYRRQKHTELHDLSPFLS
jgi:hypothetical protein